jgi:hypothetical protein
MLMLGEVSTGLLRHSTSVSSRTSTRILGLRPGEPVRWSQRPIAFAVSPDVLTGVDCPLPTASGTGARGIGTITSHAAVTGGRVLQGSAYAVLAGAAADRRLPWSHYLSRPGVVERPAKVSVPDLLDGFAAPEHTAGSLDLTAIANRTMDAVQDADDLDGVPPLRTARTRLRWTAVTAEESPAAPRISFSIDDEYRRTLTIRVPPHIAGHPDLVVAFCEDVALHDWLLTTLLDQVERGAAAANGPAPAVIRLRPAMEALAHLWMPAARMDPSLEPLWQRLERLTGFSLQWAATVGRIRDQLAMGGLALLAAAAAGTSA